MAQPTARRYIDVDKAPANPEPAGRTPDGGRLSTLQFMTAAALVTAAVALALAAVLLTSPRAATDATRAECGEGDGTAALRARAMAGDTAAQVALGNVYDEGKGVARNREEADYWYRMAAEQGDVETQWYMGFRAQCRPVVVVRDGRREVRLDWVEAAKWYLMAAEHGHLESQCLMGDLYLNGDGVSQDYAESLKWYRTAAEGGHRRAHIDVAEAYEKGLGVPKDCAEAARWYRLVAMKGMSAVSNMAQYRLGRMYSVGLGVPKDCVQAYAWLNLAAPDDYTKVAQAERDKLEKQMTPEQITAAQRKTAELRSAMPTPEAD